ncbi:MAG: hypothetical protein RIR70_372 [Pseudomonadota bacterium]
MLRTLSWLVRLVVFLLLLGLAIKNSGLVTLHFFFSNAWEIPLVMLVLVSFGVGVLTGGTASLATLYRQRREIDRLKREAASAPATIRSEAVVPDLTSL